VLKKKFQPIAHPVLAKRITGMAGGAADTVVVDVRLNTHLDVAAIRAGQIFAQPVL